MKQPVEKMSTQELLHEWQRELELLQGLDQRNPHWEWHPIQAHLERLNVLAHELRLKKAQDRAKWQP
ncbi:MAG: hypothetical protein HY423_08665 [Candidatus Lambdaproteobacteria bacterium]|nr:hypothetical protein [Candidatus Lambdaproteobacteria bacterium]